MNHLAPFLLTNLLLPRLTAAPDGARVINTASNTYRHARLDLDDLDGARPGFRIGRAYPVFRVLNSWLGRVALSSPRRGAEPLLSLATRDDPQAVNGTYFNRLKPEDPANEQAKDPDLARRLWARSAELTGLPSGAQAEFPGDEHALDL